MLPAVRNISPSKEYKVKSASRLVAVAVGLAFALVGVLIVLQGNLIGLVVALLGALVIWTGLRPNRVRIMSDAVEVHSIGVKRYPYDQVRHVRMVARRFYHGTNRWVGSRSGGSSVRIAIGDKRFRMYPEIQIEGDFPHPLILEIEYVGQLRHEDGQPYEGRTWRFKRGARFDTQAVLGDILAHLPSGVQIDPAVHEYAATGSLPDVTTLPVENPHLSLAKQA